MRGTLINAATVLGGSIVGRAGGDRLPEPVRASMLRAIGLFTLALGVSGALRTFERGRLVDAIVVLVGLVAGAMLGTALDIEGRIERVGARLQRGEAHGLSQGFLTASLVFCVGPLTILGALQDGLSGDYSLLAVKAAMDGLAAVALSAVYGLGVAASVVTILVYQGAITLGASVLRDAFTPDVLRSLDAVGGLLILGIGLRLLDVTDVKVGNMLPALVLVPAGAALVAA